MPTPVHVYYSHKDKGKELIIAVLNTHKHIPIDDLRKYIADVAHPSTESYIALVDHPGDNRPDDIREAIDNLFNIHMQSGDLYKNNYAIVNDIRYDIYFHKVI